MGLQLATPIATARGILNDPDAVRYSAADLLTYANDSLDALVAKVPTLFHARGTVTCISSQVEQKLNNGYGGVADALALVRVDRITGVNSAVTLVDRSALEAFNPNWANDDPGLSVHWMPSDTSPLHFYIYPKPQIQVLDVIYVKVPGEYTTTQDTGVPTAFSDALADYIVYRAESRNDEAVLSERAQMFLNSFNLKIGG